MADPPTGFAQINLPMSHTAFPRRAEVTFGVQDAGPAANPGALCEAVWDAFTASGLLGVGDANVTYGPVECRVNYGSGAVQGIGSSSAAGGSSIDPPSANVAVLVKKISNLTPGRGGRGRFYWPWFVEESVVDPVGIIDSGYVAGHQALFSDFLGELTTNDVPMVILHAAGGSPAIVGQLLLESQVATQRRRLGR